MTAASVHDIHYLKDVQGEYHDCTMHNLNDYTQLRNAELRSFLPMAGKITAFLKFDIEDVERIIVSTAMMVR